ncbi:MAG: YegS/Rv2252/BmrU family lipid kinase [Bacteroidetes bacterium]|nr:YegS/Rv2252/BmrU family lipid kinase [Bacteroidota bacterium]
MNSSILLIVNPVAGIRNGVSFANHVKKTTESSNTLVAIFVSKQAGHIIKHLSSTDLSVYSKIGVIGGDGTFHEVVNGVCNNPNFNYTTPLFLFPAGTGNSLCHDLNILDLEKSIAVFTKGNTQTLDILEIETSNQKIYSFNIIGYGLVATINKTAEKLRIAGSARYNIASILEIIKNKNYRAQIRLDNTQAEDDWCFLLACNTIHTGKGMKMAPNALVNDGFVDVLLIKKVSVLQLLSLFPKIFAGKHVLSPLVKIHKVKEFEILPSKGDTTINIDGELKGDAPIKVKLQPNKLVIIHAN